MTDLLQLATAEPVLKVGLNFVPGAAAFSPLSTKLGSMLSDEIKSNNKPWEEKTLLGLRTDEGLAALNGRQFVVLLDPDRNCAGGATETVPLRYARVAYRLV